MDPGASTFPFRAVQMIATQVPDPIQFIYLIVPSSAIRRAPSPQPMLPETPRI